MSVSMLGLLPDEMLCHIGSYLNMRDTQALKLVDTRFEKIIADTFYFLFPYHGYNSEKGISEEQKKDLQAKVIVQLNADILSRTAEKSLKKFLNRLNSHTSEKKTFLKFNTGIWDTIQKLALKILSYYFGNAGLKKDSVFIEKDTEEFLLQKRNILSNPKHLLACHSKNISRRLQEDKDFILAAVTKDGFDLLFVSETLKNDKEVVLAAIHQNGRALRYASETLRNDKGVVLAAIKQNDSALQYASERLSNDKEFFFQIFQQKGYL